MKYLPFLILLLLLFGIVLRIDFILYLVYVCVGIYVVARWVTPRVFDKLLVTRTFTPNAFLGETVPITLKFDNTSWLSLAWLQVQEIVPPRLRTRQTMNQTLSVKGKRSGTVTYKVLAQRRGYYQVGPLRLTSGDVFGLKRIRSEVSADYLTVYPRIIPLSQLRLPSRLPFGTVASRQRMYEDPARPTGVRQYRSGDSLRQINWKVSARYAQSAQSNLMVKTLESAISLETFVVLNLKHEEYDARDRDLVSEWSIEVATSVAAHLTNQRQAVGVATNAADPLAGENTVFDESSGRLLSAATDGDSAEKTQQSIILPKTGRLHLMKVLGLLARVELHQAATPFASWLPHATLGLSWGTTILVVTPTVSAELSQALHRLARRGYNPILILTDKPRDIAAVRGRAKHLGYLAFEVLAEKDLNL